VTFVRSTAAQITDLPRWVLDGEILYDLTAYKETMLDEKGKGKNISVSILRNKSGLHYRIPFEDGTSVSLSSFCEAWSSALAKALKIASAL
jgi:hypothetical protein